MSIELRIRDATIPIRYWGIGIDLGSIGIVTSLL